LKRILNLMILKGSDSGFTLVETLVALGILSMTLGVIGGGILQTLSIEKFWLEDVTATREVRHAGSWYAGDALNAEEVCRPGTSAELAGGSSSVDVTLAWYDVVDVNNLPADVCKDIVNPGLYTLHTATYAQSGNSLLRTVNTDGVQVSQLTLSQKVVNVNFTRSGAGDVLTMTLEVNAERNTTETLTLDTFLRRLR